MYRFLYDNWDVHRFPGYQISMNHLYDNSISYYATHDFDSENSRKDMEKIDQLFQYQEYYFASLMRLGFAGKSNFDTILQQLKGILLIKLLEPKLRDRLNGLTYNRVITMNPYPGCYTELDQEESLEISMYHELGHIITSCNKDDIEFLVKCIYHPDVLQSSFPDVLFENGKDDVEKGFELLDEVAVQNVAEEVFHFRRGLNRPTPKKLVNRLLYPNSPFSSNFHEYREFQELAYQFALCLKFLNCKEGESMDAILNRFSKAMFSKDFCSKLFLEFQEDPSKGEDLVMMLICMGKIKNAKYSSFGLGTIDRDKLDMSPYFRLFHSLALKNRCVEDSKAGQKIRS